MRRLRTLVAEDNGEYLRTCVRWLEAQPEFEVVGCARSGEEAIEHVRRLRPDVVLMDLAMPGLGGLEATRVVKTEPDAPLVVIVSIWDSQVTRAEAELVGADGYVSKPHLTTHLLPVLREFARAGKASATDGGTEHRGKHTDDRLTTLIASRPHDANSREREP